MAVDDIPEVDELFALPPGQFTAARDHLARRLRSDGDRAAASEVKQLRRPTVAAWAVNQLVRRHRAEVTDLVRSGAALTSAQHQALSGAGGGLREATRQRSALLRRVSALADDILGAGAGAHRQDVVATLTAASSDPSAGEEVLRGRLSEAFSAPTGFTFGSNAAPVPRTGRRGAGHRDASRRTGTDRGEDEAAAAAARAAEEAAAAARAAEALRAEAERAAQAADRARRCATAASERVGALEGELATARRDAGAAADRAGEEEARARAAGRRARRAEEEARRLLR